MKQTANVTLSLSCSVISRLHRSLPKGRISRFTDTVLNKALDELDQKSHLEQERAYAKAFSDKAREIESKDWNECDEYQVENWDWYEEK